ncbi:S-adenosyl-L-methionine-dependent methyltransferases superfamily protein [Striga hermonthica]|uniref:S-adenosyl-L-methionine-dependent methyltransferases superfamily protein n=1 Tax=Striga hermonthica TaxID=68872 RepID=A0A9N7P0A2_STRHE|nr:S-adenosyl-L-methionine-dependent methyltransferases superfamily protein [Striga hermonthica]
MATTNGGVVDTIVQVPYNASVRLALASLERNLLPDAVVRRLTRLLLAARLRSGYRPSAELQLSDLLQFVHSLKDMPIAIKTERPKSQHYELPTSFFELVLGKHLKYRQHILRTFCKICTFSCCYFLEKSSTLEDAEKAMLELYCERSQIEDGHSVLDVGCGWGSLSLYIAQKYPSCKVTGICNSVTQKAHIDEQCRVLELQNVEITVADISTFEMEASYDRIFSIEMFEHMKNYRDLLKKISNWLKSDGLLFVHHFCHKIFAYHFEDVNEDDWITRYFFTGGTMPSANLLLYFQDDVSVVNHWLVNGKHYAQTSEEWLKRMDHNMSSVKPIMESTYGKDSAVKWTAYWRTFFISVAELFGYNDGEEWMVTHFLFKKK